jgi:hypothetical protein
MRGHRAYWPSPLIVVFCAFGLTSCFDTTINYQRDAEAYIDDTVAEVLGVSFSQVECERPIDQNVGTRFECTALDTANGTWVFDNEIIAENEFEVNVFSRP